MPNKTIYLNTIKNLEKSVGASFLNYDELSKTLQEAWQNDETPAKVNYLTTYRKVFRGVLSYWTEREIKNALYSRAKKKPDLQKFLLKTDEALKVCALSLIPGLRENEDVLSNMTFGGLTPAQLKKDFVEVRAKYLDIKEANNATKKRNADNYAKYKAEWIKISPRAIVEKTKIYNLDALAQMTEEEKLEQALALNSYRNDPHLPLPLGQFEKDIIDDALAAWKTELNCPKDMPLENLETVKYVRYADELAKEEWLDTNIAEAAKEYNSKAPTPAKKDLEDYQKTVTNTANARHIKEAAIPTQGIEDDTAEMVGNFFMQEELKRDIANAPQENPVQKERAFLEERVMKFNEIYSLRVNKDKLRTSVEQISALMIKAREEKENFMSKDNVVVIENGETKCYSAKEYYKDEREKINKSYESELQKLHDARAKAKKDFDATINSMDVNDSNMKDFHMDETQRKAMKEMAENNLQEKYAQIDAQLAVVQAKIADEMAAFKGGIVIEKNGNDVKQYSSSRYYETHETKKEQYAYGEYQKMYSLLYKDACKNIKQRNYPKGKETDVAAIAKDVDTLFKSAMYISKVYDNDKNVEIIQKSSFGGFSAEKLAALATEQKGDPWLLNQSSEAVWAKQVSQAKGIISQFKEAEESKRAKNPSMMVKLTLDKKRDEFAKGLITRKQLLDYMLAADSHIQDRYPTRWDRWNRSTQYKREKNALNECYQALGLNPGDSLRVAMNQEYTRMANNMSKEEIFKSIGAKMNGAGNFKEQQTTMSKAHQIVQDRILAEKTRRLDELRAQGKEPISIDSLDERKNILNQKPRSPMIKAPAQKQRTLAANQ